MKIEALNTEIWATNSARARVAKRESLARSNHRTASQVARIAASAAAISRKRPTSPVSANICRYMLRVSWGLRSTSWAPSWPLSSRPGWRRYLLAASGKPPIPTPSTGARRPSGSRSARGRPARCRCRTRGSGRPRARRRTEVDGGEDDDHQRGGDHRQPPAAGQGHGRQHRHPGVTRPPRDPVASRPTSRTTRSRQRHPGAHGGDHGGEPGTQGERRDEPGGEEVGSP